MATIPQPDAVSLRGIAALLGVMSPQDVDLSLLLLKQRYPRVPWHLLIAAGETASTQGSIIDTGGQIIAGASGQTQNVATMVAVDGSGRIKIMPRLSTFAVVHQPAVNTIATITQAGFAGNRNVCTGIAASIGGSAASVKPSLFLRDGATGIGTVLWTIDLQSVANGVDRVVIAFPDPIVGTVNAAMTLEFAAAGGANTFENVSLCGFQIGVNDTF